MPEIAEVETVRNTLKKRILNKKIVDVKIFYNKIIENDDEEFKKKVIGEEFVDILRKGKWLIFELNNYYLLSHLRMEGKFFIKPLSEAKEKHEHVMFVFQDNETMRYHDTRKFGRMRLINKDELETAEEIAKLGVEANDKKLSSEYLLDKFKNKKLPIKTVLLDQTIISGLGNIYVNEVLYYAGINPLKDANTLNKDECEKIVKGSKEIIDEAIKMGGTTIRSYTSSLGVTGHYQEKLKVHGKVGELCPKCKTKLEKIAIGGRSTYFCPKCQK